MPSPLSPLSVARVVNGESTDTSFRPVSFQQAEEPGISESVLGGRKSEEAGAALSRMQMGCRSLERTN
jgi:hypothetical protein